MLFSCNIEANSNLGISKTKSKKDGFDIRNCMDNILYYDLEIDLEEYDSLGTYFFHEILDYSEAIAITHYDELKQLKWRLKENQTLINEDEKKSLENKIDSLQQLLSGYKQVVSGYVFVHTFKNSSDTLSMIFVMDTACGFSEAIPIKTIYDPDPDKYSSQIRQIK